MTDEMLLPCPVEGCPGVLLGAGMATRCGGNALWREDHNCAYENGQWRLPALAADPHGAAAVWVEWVDGVTDTSDVAMEFAEHMEGEKGWELRFESIVTMQAERKDGAWWWYEIDVPENLPDGVTPLPKRPAWSRPNEDVRQFWKFVYWRARTRSARTAGPPVPVSRSSAP